MRRTIDALQKNIRALCEQVDLQTIALRDIAHRQAMAEVDQDELKEYLRTSFAELLRIARMESQEEQPTQPYLVTPSEPA